MNSTAVKNPTPEAAINTNFDAYQAHVTANVTFAVAHKLDFITLALCGETGELAEKVKKLLRGDYELTPEVRELMAKELGDILWHVARVASILDYNLSDVVRLNNEKLTLRRTENKIKGNGDTR